MTTHPLTPLHICYIVGAIVAITLILETVIYCAARVLDAYEDTIKDAGKAKSGSDGESQSEIKGIQVVLSILRILTYPCSCSLCRRPELNGTRSRNGSIWRRLLQLAGLYRFRSDRPSWVSHSTIRHGYFSEKMVASRRYFLYNVSNIHSLDTITDLKTVDSIKSTNSNPVMPMTPIKVREDPVSAEVEDTHRPVFPLQSTFEQLVDNYPEYLYLSHTHSSTTNHSSHDPDELGDALTLCAKRIINGKTEYLGPIAHITPCSRRLQVKLSETDAEFVVERAWGVRFCDRTYRDVGYSDVFCSDETDRLRSEWIDVLMPTDGEDVAVVLEIVKAGVWLGVSLPRDGDGVCYGRGDEEKCGYGYGCESGHRSEDEERGGEGEKTSMSMAMAAW